MNAKSKPNRQISNESAARISAGSRRGAESVSQEFSSVLTRRRLREEVDIHETTLKRWEKLGIMKPRMESVLGISTAVYDPIDVERARLIKKTLEGNRGLLSAKQAAALVDTKLAGRRP